MVNSLPLLLTENNVPIEIEHDSRKKIKLVRN